VELSKYLIENVSNHFALLSFRLIYHYSEVLEVGEDVGSKNSLDALSKERIIMSQKVLVEGVGIQLFEEFFSLFRKNVINFNKILSYFLPGLALQRSEYSYE